MAQRQSVDDRNRNSFGTEAEANENIAASLKPEVRFIGGVYRSTLPAYTNGQNALLHLTADGKLLTSPSNAFAASTTSSNATVGNSTGTVLAANAARKYAVIVNDSDEAVYLKLGSSAEMNKGIRLNAHGGSLEINSTNLYTGIITGICASGGKVVTVTEA